MCSGQKHTFMLFFNQKQTDLASQIHTENVTRALKSNRSVCHLMLDTWKIPLMNRFLFELKLFCLFVLESEVV